MPTPATCIPRHVVPIDDLRPHVLPSESDDPCWCQPSIDSYEEGDVTVHNSLDGREQFETGKRKPS